MVIAIIAAEDCTHIVRTLPSSKKSKVEPNPHPPQDAKKSIISWLWARSISRALVLKVQSPRNISEKPKMNSPSERVEFFLRKMSTMATANNGNTTVPISNWKPNTDIIHAVAVVPIFAPIITEIACASERRPALTKLTVSTVVAVEDCTAAVTNAPVSSPVKRLVVIAPRTLRKWPPVSFWSASLIVFIPYIRRARHPRSFRKVKIVIGLIVQNRMQK